MEMALHLPRQYEEIEEEEMMYLDGGYYTNLAIGTNFLAHCINAAVGYIAGSVLGSSAVVGVIASKIGVANSTIRSALSFLGVIGTYIFGFIGTSVAGWLDRNKNGWVGLHYNYYRSGSRYYYTE